MADTTTIKITVETWVELNQLRRLGESMDAIVHRLIQDEIKYLKLIEPNATRLVEAF